MKTKNHEENLLIKKKQRIFQQLLFSFYKYDWTDFE